jgi:hypothetical protein
MNLIRKFLSITVFIISLLFFSILPFYLNYLIHDGESIVSSFISLIFASSFPILLFLISKWLWFIPKQVNKPASNLPNLQDSVVIKVPDGIQYEIKLSSPNPTNQTSEVLKNED